MMIDRISLLLVIIGALNWGSVALFQLDLVAYLFGGSDAMISRVVYAPVSYTHLERHAQRQQHGGDPHSGKDKTLSPCPLAPHDDACLPGHYTGCLLYTSRCV